MLPGQQRAAYPLAANRAAATRGRSHAQSNSPSAAARTNSVSIDHPSCMVPAYILSDMKPTRAGPHPKPIKV